MSSSYNQIPGWEDYLGDTLRGNAPVNQLIPQHPYLLDTLQLEEVLHKNTEHIMLLTTDEASAVISELYNIGTTYAGNIKDSLSGVKKISKLVSYKEAEKIILSLKGLGIKAQTYIHQGVTYIKITGYPSLRRILNGTRYTVNNPKILDVGIGNAGINMGILSGARWCVYFSGAQRVVEFIISSKHDLATFIGNVTMDMAKIIVTIFVSRMPLVLASGIVALVSATIPISVTIFVSVVVGFYIVNRLSTFDDNHDLSKELIKKINQGLHEQHKIVEWNMSNSSVYFPLLTDGHY